MNIRLSTDCAEIHWEGLRSLLRRSGMGTYAAARHQAAFENSAKAVFLFAEDVLIGCGRLVSDGAYQGAIYDIAVNARYRGQGLGRSIVEELLLGEDDLNIMLYAAPGKEGFYSPFGFRNAKTAMLRPNNPAAMESAGFLEPVS